MISSSCSARPGTRRALADPEGEVFRQGGPCLSLMAAEACGICSARNEDADDLAQSRSTGGGRPRSVLLCVVVSQPDSDEAEEVDVEPIDDEEEEEEEDALASC
eukprot:4738232-Heterocapsa_arctica.AAC.1